MNVEKGSLGVYYNVCYSVQGECLSPCWILKRKRERERDLYLWTLWAKHWGFQKRVAKTFSKGTFVMTLHRRKKENKWISRKELRVLFYGWGFICESAEWRAAQNESLQCAILVINYAKEAVNLLRLFYLGLKKSRKSCT